MHRDSAFWKDQKRARRYREKKRKELLDRDPRAMQRKSTRRAALNLGHKIRNAGHTFSTMEEYLEAHQHVVGRISTKQKKIDSLRRLFGSIEGFIAALDSENHKVESVEPIGDQQRYAVVVSAAGGHPLHTPPVVIWPVGNNSPFGAGLVLHT